MIRGDNLGAAKRQVFVDESLTSALTLVAVSFPSDAVVETRRRVRQLLLPQQTHLHFTREGNGRRRLIIKAMMELELACVVYEYAGRESMRAARRRCLEALVDDLAESACERLVIESDESLRDSDRRTLYAAVRDAKIEHSLAYVHVSKRGEPLLWVADALAWCWTHRSWRSELNGPEIVVRRVADRP